jgi:uncharacterized damage-inducible protein DinB
MSADRKIIDKALACALSGTGAHVETAAVFASLDWKLAGVRRAKIPHSIFQLLNHMSYWQDWAVRWLDGKNPPLPRHAVGSWPGRVRPSSQKEWEQAVRRFRRELRALLRRSRQPNLFAKPGIKSRLELLHAIASHNSYHAGQVVLIRQSVRAWPPASGGLTW